MPDYLMPGASPETLIRANAANHFDWFGDGFRREDGVRWKDGLIAFPRPPAAVAGERLDAILARHRTQEPREIACWSLLPTVPRDLGARLLARGFDRGWQPHWMALDLARRTDFAAPPGVTITLDHEGEWDVEELPYLRNTRLPPTSPRQYRFAARKDGRIVGQTLLHVTTGRLGVGGIYNVGVVPSERGRGIGRAITAFACRHAAALGCHYAVLNAATHIYDRIGFVSLGYGQTWFLRPEVLVAEPPTPTQVAFFEAAGRGDRRALGILREAHPGFDLDAPLASGMTLLETAVLSGKPAAARWLIDRGATPDIIFLWELGRRDEAAATLAARPELANRPVGRDGMTLLHFAAARDDRDLALLALSANPDRTARDRRYNGTPLNWAEILGRHEIAGLIRV
ncbi:MAG: GNAT family N-acetyltransferase [Capsulimonadales bacterium]|nr:GNAT family N-acetyltransferase [Capsulimonadales bacterium]